MGDDQCRNAQAEHELQRLDRLPAKLPALVQRPDAETGVDQRRAIEHDRDRGKLPERGVVMEPVASAAIEMLPSAWLRKWLTR